MSTIRKQSIISTFVVYIGFAIGFFNTYLFTRQGGFTKEQFGLTAIFLAAAQLMYSIANLGTPSVIHKFYPYYKAHVPQKKNDLLTRALLLTCLGFLLVTFLGIVFKETLVTKIFSNSPELLKYFYWLFPFGFGYTVFMLLDVYVWQLGKAVLSNLMKEVVYRASVTLLIVLTTFAVIRSFDVFIGLYAFTYLTMAIFLLFFLINKGHLHLTLHKSIVTQKFRKKMIALMNYVWSGILIYSLASVIDTILIAAVLPNGIGLAGVFTFGQYMTSLIQAPQRAVISAATGPLSAAWREKDYDKINKIYHRSSINQLLFACAMFILIWLNFEDGIRTFHLQPDYLAARWVFFFIGLTRIVDMGTGVNSQIIGTSTFWRFEFFSGLVLLALMLPLNYFLTVKAGIVGPAIANLISFTVYNGLRYVFLLRKFNMQPFDRKTVYALLLSAACFVLAYFPYRNETGLHWIILRSLTFLLPFSFFTLQLKLTPDAIPVWQTVKKRLGVGQ
jgi:O-antigen/teichoic acid export membrane protein